ncbi:hypothetical protein BpHYR1_054197 [Brachionus plicatilis]|uniref:Uncharacterized protein n=1 Tax=Brachionus plicatilis TaxID=10195 RepID=A0A3M7P249_BRAPC|nr:hypothetical protein BpHYR1_054197 [Brachionus plicatilis]
MFFYVSVNLKRSYLLTNCYCFKFVLLINHYITWIQILIKKPFEIKILWLKFACPLSVVIAFDLIYDKICFLMVEYLNLSSLLAVISQNQLQSGFTCTQTIGNEALANIKYQFVWKHNIKVRNEENFKNFKFLKIRPVLIRNKILLVEVIN